MRRIPAPMQDLLYVKIMPSDPATIPFYARYGFRQYDHYSAMVRNSSRNLPAPPAVPNALHLRCDQKKLGCIFRDR